MESAIVNLRAELHKKRLEANNLSGEFKLKKKLPSLHKERRSKKDLHDEGQVIDIQTDEEASKLAKSRQALEKKAALYDKLKGGTEVLEDDELNQRFLIDFQEKIHNEVSEAKKLRGQKLEAAETGQKVVEPESYKTQDPSEEWVEYTDDFGRTRVCQRRDVEYHRGQQGRPKESEDEAIAQGKRTKLYERWERVEDESTQKKDIHYQDVLFDEARAHGTGFMAFSRDEAERAAQQQFLKDLGSEAQKAAVSKEALNRKRQKMMKERLVKVRQRKRLKMGLPITDDSLKTPPPSDEEAEEIPRKSPSPPPLPPHPQTEEKMPVAVREWDLGKPGVGSTLSQEQWIASRRKVRENDFAPPSTYDQRRPSAKFHSVRPPTESSVPRTSSPPCAGGQEEGRGTESHWGRTEVAPPTTYDYYGPSTTKRNFSLGRRVDVESAISKGLASLRKQHDLNSDG